jgi:DNA-binding HxlR family transcriptional regulator
MQLDASIRHSIAKVMRRTFCTFNLRIWFSVAPHMRSDACHSSGYIMTPIYDQCSLLILREVHYHVRSFESFLTRLNISKLVLQAKLCELISRGLLRALPNREHSEDREYVLTAKGFEFLPVAFSMLRLFGEDVTKRRGGDMSKGTVFDGVMICADCSETLAREIVGAGHQKRWNSQSDRQLTKVPVTPYCAAPDIENAGSPAPIVGMSTLVMPNAREDGGSVPTRPA